MRGSNAPLFYNRSHVGMGVFIGKKYFCVKMENNRLQTHSLPFGGDFVLRAMHPDLSDLKRLTAFFFDAIRIMLAVRESLVSRAVSSFH